jgi:signal transduction histidine kinase
VSTTGEKHEPDIECTAPSNEPWSQSPVPSAPRFATGTQRTNLQDLQGDAADADDRDEPILLVHHSPTFERNLWDAEVDLIVHDLKSPLATITLEASLLDEQLVRVESSAMRSAVHRIRRNAEYVARIVEDLLDLSAIDHGRLTIRHRRVELLGLLQQVIERAIATRDLDRMSLIADAPVIIDADALRIERVIANLLQNALKYAPGRSPIVVRLDRIGELVRVSVTDAGPGIDVAEQKSIFDKYRRGTNTRTNDGCGLGLYVSKRIVDAHGGRIGVDSVRGRGSCFYFELPVA